MIEQVPAFFQSIVAAILKYPIGFMVIIVVVVILILIIFPTKESKS